MMAGCSDSAAKESRDDDVVQALQAMMRNGRGFPGTRPGEEELTRLRRLYETSGYTPLWVSMSGDLRKSGKEAIERLRNADSEGLRPADYFAGSLDSLARRISDQESPDPAGVARLDAGLSHAVLESAIRSTPSRSSTISSRCWKRLFATAASRRSSGSSSRRSPNTG
jgi:hypothetical protein